MRRRFAGRDEGRPGHARLRIILSGLARNGRYPDEMIAIGTLNLAARQLFIALEMLVARRAGEFKIAHGHSGLDSMSAADAEAAKPGLGGTFR